MGVPCRDNETREEKGVILSTRVIYSRLMGRDFFVNAGRNGYDTVSDTRACGVWIHGVAHQHSTLVSATSLWWSRTVEHGAGSARCGIETLINACQL